MWICYTWIETEELDKFFKSCWLTCWCCTKDAKDGNLLHICWTERWIGHIQVWYWLCLIMHCAHNPQGKHGNQSTSTDLMSSTTWTHNLLSLLGIPVVTGHTSCKINSQVTHLKQSVLPLSSRDNPASPYHASSTTPSLHSHKFL